MGTIVAHGARLRWRPIVHPAVDDRLVRRTRQTDRSDRPVRQTRQTGLIEPGRIRAVLNCASSCWTSGCGFALTA